MSKLFLHGILAVLFSCIISVSAEAKSVDSDPYASSSPTRIADRVDQYLDVFSVVEGKGGEFEVYEPGASFIKLHFSQFRLPKGLEIEISNPAGTESYRYSSAHRDGFTFDTSQGEDGKSSFSAMSISGDTAIIRVHGTASGKSTKFGKSKALKHRVLVDYVLVGRADTGSGLGVDSGSSTQAVSTSGGSQIEQACGSVDYEPVACYQSDDSFIFDRTRPVARVITGAGEICTAWRVGPENRLIASKECLNGGASVSSMEVWFNYQYNHCFFRELEPITKVTGDTLLASSSTLDYVLFTVNSFSSIANFGYMGLDVRDAALNEQIYIPHHAESGPKLVSVVSDMNVGGVCRVDSVNDADNNEIGYFCDTWYGASGAPVMASGTDRVLAMNHNTQDNCYNTGVKMSRIWPEISSHFGGVIPAGDLEDNNQLPEADLGWSCSKMQCNFNASGSSDPDGFIVANQWDTGDGFTTSEVSFSHTFAFNGTYTITLTVEDNDGGTTTATSAVTAWGGEDPPNTNQPPTATFSFGCTSLDCSFNASGSYDPDGSITSYSWDFGDGQTAQGNFQTVSHSYGSAGSYVVVLTVQDDDGATGSFNSNVSVVGDEPPVNNPPVADFTYSCNDLTCSFNGSPSSDPDGPIASYQWNFGDGGSSSGVSRSHTFGSSGTYQVKLTVRDDQDATDSRTRSVQVTAPPPPPPPGNINLNGSGSKVKGTKKATLSWSGATSTNVQIVRDGSSINVTSNDGSYVDSSVPKRQKSADYQVCESAGSPCSNTITVRF